MSDKEFAPVIGSTQELFTKPVTKNGHTYKKEYYHRISTQEVDLTTPPLTIKTGRGEVHDPKAYVIENFKYWKTIKTTDLLDYININELYNEVQKGAIGYKVNSINVTLSEPESLLFARNTSTVAGATIKEEVTQPPPTVYIGEFNCPNQINPLYARTHNDSFFWDPSQSNELKHNVDRTAAYTAVNSDQNLIISTPVLGGIKTATQVKSARTFTTKSEYDTGLKQGKLDYYTHDIMTHTPKVAFQSDKPYTYNWTNTDDRFISFYPFLPPDILHDFSDFSDKDVDLEKLGKYLTPLPRFTQNQVISLNETTPYAIHRPALSNAFPFPLTIPANCYYHIEDSDDSINFDNGKVKYATTTERSPEPKVIAYQYLEKNWDLDCVSTATMVLKITYEADIEFIYRNKLSTYDQNTTEWISTLFKELPDATAGDVFPSPTIFTAANTKALFRHLYHMLKTTPKNLVFLNPMVYPSIINNNRITNAPIWQSTHPVKVQPQQFEPNNFLIASNTKKRKKDDL